MYIHANVNIYTHKYLCVQACIYTYAYKYVDNVNWCFLGANRREILLVGWYFEILGYFLCPPSIVDIRTVIQVIDSRNTLALLTEVKVLDVFCYNIKKGRTTFLGLLESIRNNRRHGSCPRKMDSADKMSSNEVIREVEL